jgi:MFS superfamily sulfate permease-like transporter
LAPIASLVTVVELMSIREFNKFGKSEVAIYKVTVCSTEAVHLLTGVFSGIALSILKLLHTFTKLDTKIAMKRKTNRTILNISEAPTFFKFAEISGLP